MRKVDRGRNGDYSPPPRTDPTWPNSGTRLPPWVRDGKANVRPWMKDPGFREKVVSEPLNPLPREFILLTASPQRAQPEDFHVVVAHRPRADPQRMKHLLDCCRVVGTEVGFLLVRCSPCSSWTRGSWSTPDCVTGRHRPRSTLLRVLIAGAPRRRRVRSKRCKCYIHAVVH